jgi:UDP-3-O-[3-hydroxymyristoyl] glucosamine N-acyltransferase
MADNERRPWRLDELVSRLGGELHGDPAIEVFQVASLASATAGSITFLSSERYRSSLAGTRASAVVLAPATAGLTTLPKIVHANPYAYYARLVALLNPFDRPSPGVHPSAVVDSEIPESVSVGANAVIGRRVLIGEGVCIAPGCILGDEVAIGADSYLHPNVTIAARCTLGARAVVQSGAVIGGDGFGFAKESGRWVKIPQIGRVVIGDDVEIGANTTIDRGALEDTVIGNDVKLDNQIQIAHNVRIGDHTAIAGCVGIAGSTSIGSRCTIGGAAMIIGHLEIVDDVHVSAGTLIGKDISRPGQYTGSFPMDVHQSWLKNAAKVRHLDEMHRKLRLLEKQVAVLDEALRSSKNQ